ncbi:haloacid dehalogenase-like hydrolase [Microcella alkalica]|uniref:Phosphoglycolate phosphatase-like HAD superfamily hydrolase n=1 Tax=Microcella alkalica TaxID=355930 RepID=A0A839E9P5_9MICO|nr:phosphoglycolate phosphatase-like HAD superfamily hydrolase [Microcella alkalica]
MTTTTILWDVDGTLLFNAASGGGELYHAAVEAAAGRALHPPLPRAHGKTDGQILFEILEAFDLDAELHDDAVAALDALSVERAKAGDRRAIAPGIPQAIAAAADRGWINALLTGNSATRSRVKLAGAGLEPDLFDWSRSFFGDRSRERRDITLAARSALPDERLVIIGDTPRDDIAAVAAGIPFIAVATGVYTVDALRQTGALIVVPTIAEGLDAVLDVIESLPGVAAA